MILHGDCLEQMRTLDANSVDSIVTDPPYGLSFMGKKWDYDVPSVEIWREALRVLKPGGHLLAFGGTRTYHRLAVNIEDAGFEIRDCIQWLYGSGFPKSTDVSKRIDKEAGAEREVLGVDKSKLRPNKKGSATVTSSIETKGNEGHKDNGATITTPSTDSAKQWQGWGTALKPANEPVCYAQKRFEPVPHSDILTESFLLLELLLWSILDAQSAENLLQLSQATQKNVSTVRPLAALFPILKSKELFDMMATSNLPETGLMFSNIVTLWKNIWDESLKNENTSTIKMRSSLTIELKTLNSLILQIMPANIILAAINQNGLWLSVPDAVKNLNDPEQLNQKLTFAQTDAIARLLKITESTLAKIVESILKESQVTSENSAQSDVQDNSIINYEASVLNTYVSNAKVNLKLFLLENPNTAVGSVWQSPTKNLTPANEPIVVARKPLEAKLTVAQNVQKYGTGALNIDASRIANQNGELPKGSGNGNKNSKFSQVANSPGNGGNESTQGRWPANVILDEEASGRLDEQVGDNVSRFYYCAKASKAERNKGCESLGAKEKQGARPNSSDSSGKFPDHDHRATGGNNHPTVKPIALMAYLVRLVTPLNGTVLDPFMGSGSTLVAAKSLGFKFIGCELNQEYVEIAKKRINA